MRYASPAALRTVLEARLLSQSRETGVDLGRLRRRVGFERLLARLARSRDAGWVLKGGMAEPGRGGGGLEEWSGSYWPERCRRVLEYA